MNQELFEAIERITGHHCLDSEIQEILTAMKQDQKESFEINNLIINKLKERKTENEMPNNNDSEYNQGYVKAMNDIINLLSK